MKVQAGIYSDLRNLPIKRRCGALGDQGFRFIACSIGEKWVREARGLRHCASSEETSAYRNPVK